MKEGLENLKAKEVKKHSHKESVITESRKETSSCGELWLTIF